MLSTPPIHDIGQQEAARIEAGMEAVQKRAGFAEDRGARLGIEPRKR
ncbi:hypothetical protein SBBP2_1290010 [Burkholderiales bacterium]|nr:hypothetical protein SBBP2_1290010 [Burkholderiales bacterium]